VEVDVQAESDATGCLADLQRGFERAQDIGHLHRGVAHLQGFFAIDPAFDFFLSRDDRRVLAVAEVFADFRKGCPGVFACEEHREHSWLAQRLAFGFGLELLVLQSERLANGLFDIVQTNDRTIGTDDVTDGAGGFLGAQFATEHTVFGYQAKHDALKDPRIGPALLGDPS